MSKKETMIEVKDLTKTYGGIRALDGVSFEVRRGEVLGFLGPNGAGKTTTMKILTCFIAPTSGRASVAGHDIFDAPLEVRRKVGYLPENAPHYADMRVAEYLDFVGEVRRMAKADRARAIERVVEECGLGEVVDQEIRTLSKGFRQRAGLAQAMIHDPQILILDEPTSGLDPNQIADIRDLIRSIGQERTVILSTHHLAEVQATAGRVLIVHRGRLVADGTPQELERKRGGIVYDVSIQGGREAADKAQDVFGALAGIKGVEILSEAPGEVSLAVKGEGEADLRAEVFRAAVDGGLVLLGLSMSQVELESIFRSLTREDENRGAKGAPDEKKEVER